MNKRLVIIPAYNEELNISDVVGELKGKVPACDILVVDDGSSDRTAVLAEEAGADVITLPFNCGIGAAVQTGFKYAREKRYGVALQLDADGQHDPSFIKDLAREIENKNADVVIGSRFLKAGSYKVSFMRMVGIWIFSKVNSFILKQYISDNTSGFRAYNEKALDFLAENYPRDYPEPEAVVALGINGFKIKEIPVFMRARKRGRSSIHTARPVYYMIKVPLAIFMNVLRPICKKGDK